MILGLGMDLIEVPRIAEMIKTDRFLQRIYTPAERAAIAEKGAQTAAGYFAAKEAVAKALGTGFTGFGPAPLAAAHSIDEFGNHKLEFPNSPNLRPSPQINSRHCRLELTVRQCPAPLAAAHSRNRQGIAGEAAFLTGQCPAPLAAAHP